MRPEETVSSRLVLPTRVLADARVFFEERGALGLEGTAMVKAGAQVELVIPRQHAHRGAGGGVHVEVGAEGQLDLMRHLAPEELYRARIHSHPGDAFHSAADDANPVITFEGALSIVVPFFGLGLRRGLGACAVYVHNRGRWVDLPPGGARDAMLVAEKDVPS